jgi:hypothetical protein
MLRAAALLPFLRELQRFDMTSYPVTSGACYLVACPAFLAGYQNWTSLAPNAVQRRCHKPADDDFQDTRRDVMRRDLESDLRFIL